MERNRDFPDDEENKNKIHDMDAYANNDDDYVPQKKGFPFATNRWYAQHNPTKLLPTIAEWLTLGNIYEWLRQMSPGQQRRIRNKINESRAPDKKITYQHINPNSSEFNEKYAELVTHHFMLQKYVQKASEDNDKIDDEVMAEVSKYDHKKTDYHFRNIPKEVKKEIVHSLNFNPKRHNYTDEEKKKFVATFRTQYEA